MVLRPSGSQFDRAKANHCLSADSALDKGTPLCGPHDISGRKRHGLEASIRLWHGVRIRVRTHYRKWWARPDSNWGPPACEAGALTN